MTRVIQLTNLWLEHVRQSERGACECESWWTGNGGEQCQRGRGIRAQLEHALESDMPDEEEDETIRPESQ